MPKSKIQKDPVRFLSVKNNTAAAAERAGSSFSLSYAPFLTTFTTRPPPSATLVLTCSIRMPCVRHLSSRIPGCRLDSFPSIRVPCLPNVSLLLQRCVDKQRNGSSVLSRFGACTSTDFSSFAYLSPQYHRKKRKLGKLRQKPIRLDTCRYVWVNSLYSVCYSNCSTSNFVIVWSLPGNGRIRSFTRLQRKGRGNHSISSKERKDGT